MNEYFYELMQMWDKTTNEHVEWQKKRNTLSLGELFQHVQKLSREADDFNEKTSHMKDENIIEFTQEGREKHYRLNEKSPRTLEMKIKDLYLSYTIHHDMVSPDPDDETNDLLNWLSSIIGCIYLFFMLKSIETGRNWVTNIKLYDFEYIMLENLITHITEEYDFPINWADLESAKDRNEVYAKIKKITSKRTHQEKLKELIAGLRDVFPDPMSVIDKKIKNVEFNRMKRGRKGS